MRPEKAGPYFRFCIIIVYPLSSLFWKRRWQGLENIPRQGPAIVAMNHISYADPFVIGRFMWDAGRVPRFLAKASLFHAPITGRIVTGAGQIPVYRGTADADHALRAAVAALDRGQIVLIYPEGTVTRDPEFWPMQAKTGIARLALLAPDVPVLPLGQWGSQHFLNFYARRFRPLPRKTVSVSVGAPLDLRDFATGGATPAVLHAMTEHIMIAVREQVAALRGESPPGQFYPRPAVVGVGGRDGVRTPAPGLLSRFRRRGHDDQTQERA
jgi:1-acyl-sn-glycerol-3-phosphate acyltransferase